MLIKQTIKLELIIILVFLFVSSSLLNCGLIGMMQRSEINDTLKRIAEQLEQGSLYPPCYVTIKCNHGTTYMTINASRLLYIRTSRCGSRNYISFHISNGKFTKCWDYKDEDLKQLFEDLKKCQNKYR